MQRINQQALTFQTVNCQTVPPEGPRTVPLILDFSQTSTYSLSLQNMMSRNFISMIQGIFVDNSANGSPIQINVPTTGQTLQVAPNRQAYLVLLCPNPVSLNFSSNGGIAVNVTLLNFPVTNHEWPAITGA